MPDVQVHSITITPEERKGRRLYINNCSCGQYHAEITTHSAAQTSAQVHLAKALSGARLDQPFAHP